MVPLKHEWKDNVAFSPKSDGSIEVHAVNH